MRARLRNSCTNAMAFITLCLLSWLGIVAVSHAEPTLRLEVVAQKGGGIIEIELLPEYAPNHVERIIRLARDGRYNNIAFHRVIKGFMAQTGDVQYGQMRAGADLARAGTGGSTLPDLAAEFSDLNFDRGVVGMARSQSPNSANSQFFIMFAPNPSLNGQYTAFGRVKSGLDVLDRLKKGGLSTNGQVEGKPDYIRRAEIIGALPQKQKQSFLPPRDKDKCQANRFYEVIRNDRARQVALAHGKLDGVRVIRKGDLYSKSLAGDQIMVLVDDQDRVERIFCD